MSKSKYRFPYYISILFLIFFITILSYYQLFVDKKHRKLSSSLWIRPSTWKQTFQSLMHTQSPVDLTQIYWLQDNYIYQDIDNPHRSFLLSDKIPPLEIFISPTATQSAYISNNSIFLTTQTSDISLKDYSTYENIDIIHWRENESSIYIAVKDNSWKIIELKVSGEEKIIEENISYPHSFLTKSHQFIDNIIVYPECSQTCKFVVKYLDEKENDIIVEALVHSQPDDRLQDLDFKFFDASSNVIGYQATKPNENYFYVVDFNQELIQSISLSLPNKQLLYQNYIPSTKQILFTEYNANTNKTLVLTYKSNFPSLKILQGLKGIKLFQNLNNDGIYADQNKIYSTQNSKFYQLNNNKSLITAQ